MAKVTVGGIAYCRLYTTRVHARPDCLPTAARPGFVVPILNTPGVGREKGKLIPSLSVVRFPILRAPSPQLGKKRNEGLGISVHAPVVNV